MDSVQKPSEKEASLIDLTQLIPGSTVRSQLYREVPNLPRLSIQGAELIGTTSALFLKSILAEVLESDVVKAADIQQVVQGSMAFAFLKVPLEEECGILDIIEKEKRSWKEYQPKRKRETGSTRSVKKMMQSIAKPKQDDVVSQTTTDPIIADDEDYD